MIVQSSDFKGKIKIANTAQSDVATDLYNFIEEDEPKFLKQLLGKTLYADFIAGLLENPILDKWTTLKETIGNSIAIFIYWDYMGENNLQTVAMGRVKAESANASPALPDENMCKRWNEMVTTCFEVVELINNNPDDYGTYYIENFYYLGWLNNHCQRQDIFHKVNVYSI